MNNEDDKTEWSLIIFRSVFWLLIAWFLFTVFYFFCEMPFTTNEPEAIPYQIIIDISPKAYVEGVDVSVKELQAILGVNPDGVVGKRTVEAVTNANFEIGIQKQIAADIEQSRKERER